MVTLMNSIINFLNDIRAIWKIMSKAVKLEISY